jgi:AcrR family transcriptional regulator
MADQTADRSAADLGTRERLVRAAVEIVATEGVAGLTTVSVCRRVGIAQSSYYTHFASRDELLQEVAERGAAATRRTNRAARAQLAVHRDRVRLRDTMRAPLELMRAHPELFRLGLQTRHAPPSTPLGAHARELAAANRAELADDLMAMAGQADPALRRRYEMVADCIEAMVVALGEGHIDGRYPDVEEVVDREPVEGGPRSVVADERDLWVTRFDAGDVARISR